MTEKQQKDYRLTVKVRNNNILRAAERAGFDSIPKLAEAAGVSYGWLNDLINMTVAPIGKDGHVKARVDRLCLFLGCSFDELFADEQRVALESNRCEKEVSAEQIYALMAPSGRAEIEHDDGLSAHVAETIEQLRPNEQEVIRLRFGFDGEALTLAEIGERMDVTPERIRQIETKALRKLRHPSRSKELRMFVYEER